MTRARAALAACVLACGVLAPAAFAEEALPPQEAGPVRIDVAVDKRDVTIGDPIVVTVRLTHPEDVRVGAFDPERSLGDLALLDRRAPEPEKLPDGRIRETRILRVARYETGPATIPSFEAVFTGPDGKEARVATPSAAVTVSSVLAEGDTGPADIKKPAEMPERVLWPFAVAAAALALALGLWMWSRFRARRAQVAAPPEPAAPPRPPHEIAYGEMQRLLASGLLEKGRIKEFYIELAEIMKRYLEARFGVDTFERTTSEILEALRLARLPVRGMTSTSRAMATRRSSGPTSRTSTLASSGGRTSTRTWAPGSAMVTRRGASSRCRRARGSTRRSCPGSISRTCCRSSVTSTARRARSGRCRRSTTSSPSTASRPRCASRWRTGRPGARA